MGQDTECNVNVSYTCDYTPENYEIIAKLVAIPGIDVYMPHGDSDDEVLVITDTINKNSVQTIDKDVAEQYYKEYIDIDTLTFSINIIACYVLNLSRRDHPRVRMSTGRSPGGIIGRIKDTVAKFTAIGIDEADIEVDYMFHDSY